MSETINGISFWTGAEADEILRDVVAGRMTVNTSEKLDVLVDPETASLWLRRNKKNRSISQASLNRYVRDMINGTWRYTHQGIAFDPEGHLLDGQTRLTAVTIADVVVPMQVTLNLPKDAMPGIDQGRNRTTTDIYNIMRERRITSKHAAVAIRMFEGIQTMRTPQSQRERMDFIDKHFDAIDFALRQLPGGCVAANAGPRAVVARAYYSVPTEILLSFCRIIRDGKYEDHQEAAFDLREYFIKSKNTGSRRDIALLYAKTEYALSRFIEGQSAKRMPIITSERFFLPEERATNPSSVRQVEKRQRILEGLEKQELAEMRFTGV